MVLYCCFFGLISCEQAELVELIVPDFIGMYRLSFGFDNVLEIRRHKQSLIVKSPHLFGVIRKSFRGTNLMQRCDCWLVRKVFEVFGTRTVKPLRLTIRRLYSPRRKLIDVVGTLRSG